MAAEMEYTIDGLARAGDTTVRSVRVYHERGVLPPPEVRGRVGYYGSEHLNRLRTISRLLGRGMKLNGIKELLDAWDRGEDLADVLGVDDAGDHAHQEAVSDSVDDANRAANPSLYELASRLVEAGMAPDATARELMKLKADCDRLAERHITLFYRLAVHAFQQSQPADAGRAPLIDEVDFARLITAQATAELVAQALLRHLEQDHPELLPSPQEA
ncbi:MAG: MerR family transcriptional regulator [Mycobacteriaceae bacterium]|nr:MerR family transcriptional regulator [Mycobacteriaceae bacterium]